MIIYSFVNQTAYSIISDMNWLEGSSHSNRYRCFKWLPFHEAALELAVIAGSGGNRYENMYAHICIMVWKYLQFIGIVRLALLRVY